MLHTLSPHQVTALAFVKRQKHAVPVPLVDLPGESMRFKDSRSSQPNQKGLNVLLERNPRRKHSYTATLEKLLEDA